jgi:superfamily II DNA helicase RecQ
VVFPANGRRYLWCLTLPHAESWRGCVLDHANEKYSLNNNDFVAVESASETAATNDVEVDSRLHEALRKFRLNVSREENIKAYVIFNNQELEQLVSAKPKTIGELMKINGFGKLKAQKYGSRILGIIAEVAGV